MVTPTATVIFIEVWRSTLKRFLDVKKTGERKDITIPIVKRITMITKYCDTSKSLNELLPTCLLSELTSKLGI